MALSTVLRRTASTVVPLAARFIGGQRYNHHYAALFSAVKHSDLTKKIIPNTSPFPSTHHYSSSPALKRPSSDESLLRVLDSELQCAEESENLEVQEVPVDFPFEIEDNPGQQTISLSREYQGETINVEVEMSSLTTGEQEENDDDDADEDTEKSGQSSLPMVVTVSKKGGPSLEFCVTAYPDEITIDSLSVKDPEIPEDRMAYEGPPFDDLDENLQKGFHKYLEIRGIKPSTTNYLHEYMLNKDSREYRNWLKNLKNFVEA